MPIRKASAIWEGPLKEGKGTVSIPGANYEGPYTHAARFQEAEGTNPEELAGAAHAGCFSMFLSALLGKSGFTPKSIHTTAKVDLQILEDGPKITSIHLTTAASVPEVTNETFQDLVEQSKQNCPISKLFAGTEIKVTAQLLNPE